MNEKFTIVWQIITLGSFLFAGICVLIEIIIEIIKDINYKKLKKGETKDEK